MKTFYTIIGLMGIFFFSIPIHLFAAEYNPDAIEVDTLPECDQSVVNNVYALSTDNHYWKCNYVPGELRNLQVGDMIQNQILYFNIPDNFYTDNYFTGYNQDYLIISWDSAQVSPVSSVSNTRTTQIYVRKVSNGNFFVYVGGENSRYKSIYSYLNGQLTQNLSEFDLSTNVNLNNYASYPIAWIDSSNPLYQYVKISTVGRYEYEDQGEIPVLYTYDDKDFYLFYSFSMIANLDIFSNYDFISFTDYQKVVVTIGFNVLYIGVLIFFGAVLYKVIARIIRFIIG